MEDLPTIDKTPLTDDHIDSKSPPKQYWKLTTVIFGVLFIGAIALNIYSLRQKEKPSVAPSTASLPSPTETLKTSALFAMKDIVKNIQGDPVTVNVGDKHNAIAMVIFNPLPAEKKYSHVAINDQVTIYNFQTNEQKSYTSADLSPDDIVDSLNKYYADADKLGDEFRINLLTTDSQNNNQSSIIWGVIGLRTENDPPFWVSLSMFSIDTTDWKIKTWEVKNLILSDKEFIKYETIGKGNFYLDISNSPEISSNPQLLFETANLNGSVTLYRYDLSQKKETIVVSYSPTALAKEFPVLGGYPSYLNGGFQTKQSHSNNFFLDPYVDNYGDILYTDLVSQTKMQIKNTGN